MGFREIPVIILHGSFQSRRCQKEPSHLASDKQSQIFHFSGRAAVILSIVRGPLETPLWEICETSNGKVIIRVDFQVSYMVFSTYYTNFPVIFLAIGDHDKPAFE